MKKVVLLVLPLLVLVMVSCKGPKFFAKPAVKSKSELASEKDSFSYAIGTEIGLSLKDFGTEIDLNVLAQGMYDQLNDSALQVTAEQSMKLKEAVFKRVIEKKEKERAASDPEFAKMLAQKKSAEAAAAKVGEANKGAGAAFLEANKKKPGVTTTASGLQYEIIKKGTGAKPAAASNVDVHYVGTLIDGTEFDSSRKRGAPVTFPVGGVIKGWTEALLLMNEGTIMRIVLPASLAYGDQQAGPIAPNSVLVFEIELVKIAK